jgi:hypothetical protein
MFVTGRLPLEAPGRHHVVLQLNAVLSYRRLTGATTILFDYPSNQE